MKKEQQRNHIEKRRIGLLGKLGAYALFALAPAYSTHSADFSGFKNSPCSVNLSSTYQKNNREENPKYEEKEKFTKLEKIIAAISYFGILGAGACVIYRECKKKNNS